MCQWLWGVTWCEPTPFRYCGSDSEDFRDGLKWQSLCLWWKLCLSGRSWVMALSFVGGSCLLPQGHALPSGLHLLVKYTWALMQF